MLTAARCMRQARRRSSRPHRANGHDEDRVEDSARGHIAEEKVLFEHGEDDAARGRKCGQSGVEAAAAVDDPDARQQPMEPTARAAALDTHVRRRNAVNMGTLTLPSETSDTTT